jgi:cytochrome c oxidase subunit 2/cytochrome aa3-600 menaquinol oxidase subunit 2
MTKKGNPGFGLVKIWKLYDGVEKADLLSSRHRRASRLCLAFLTLSTVSGCKGSLSTVDPASRNAEYIATLWWVMLAGSAAILVLVMVLLLLAFRRTPNENQDERRQERFWIHGLGLAFPLAVLIGLLAYGLMLGEALLPRGGQDVVTVRAEARQWSWRFLYPDAPGYQTRNILHIPAGRRVDIEITSADVIHSFWSPRLAGKLDAIPGQVNVLRIEAAKPGAYHGMSAEFSGDGYSGDAFLVIAHEPAGWDAFLRRARE